MLLEINCKELNFDQYTDFVKSQNLSGCTITCKKNSQNLQDIIDVCFGMGIKNIIPTFSMAIEYDKTKERTLQKLFEFEKLLLKNNLKEALLVSGNPRKKLDTLACLQELYKSKTTINWAVAHNPFAPDQDEEKSRLKQKLKFDFVKSVYLQLGENLETLVKGIEGVRKIKKDIQIVGAVLYPTTRILNSLLLRPWFGIFYSNKFLTDIDYAKVTMQKYQSLLNQQGCETLMSCL
jgi:hypothetical protein